METIKVIDNFYSDPLKVRETVINNQDIWNTWGNWPGIRSGKVSLEESKILKDYFERNVTHSPILDWNVGANTTFQATYYWDDTWIHHDNCDYAAVLFLTPDAPLKAGTSFYRSRFTNKIFWEKGDPIINDQTTPDDSNWELVMEVGNIFNRLIVYDARCFHRSNLPGFGDNLQNCRLTQVFFWNMEMVW